MHSFAVCWTKDQMTRLQVIVSRSVDTQEQLPVEQVVHQVVEVSCVAWACILCCWSRIGRDALLGQIMQIHSVDQNLLNWPRYWRNPIKTQD